MQLCGDCNVGHGDSTKDHLHYLVVDPRWRASFPGTVKRGSPFVAWQTRIRTTGSRWTCASTCDLRELCCSLWCLRCREPLIHLLLLVIEEKLSPFRARLLCDDAPHHASCKTHLRRPRSKVQATRRLCGVSLRLRAGSAHPKKEDQELPLNIPINTLNTIQINGRLRCQKLFR